MQCFGAIISQSLSNYRLETQEISPWSACLVSPVLVWPSVPILITSSSLLYLSSHHRDAPNSIFLTVFCCLQLPLTKNRLNYPEIGMCVWWEGPETGKVHLGKAETSSRLGSWLMVHGQYTGLCETTCEMLCLQESWVDGSQYPLPSQC
jgi:hypothetical protein